MIPVITIVILTVIVVINFIYIAIDYIIIVAIIIIGVISQQARWCLNFKDSVDASGHPGNVGAL